MANINYIPTGYRQLGDVCLLASYSAILGYYQNVKNGSCVRFDICSFFHHYIAYINSLLPTIPSGCINSRKLGDKLVQLEESFTHELNSESINPNALRRVFENYVSLVLHWYCQVVRATAEQEWGIKGYLHIKEFDEYLLNNNPLRANNFIIKEHFEQDSPIHNAYTIIDSHLQAAEHNVAMVLYEGNGGYHSIMIAKDKEGIIYRDSNVDYYDRKDASFGFQFNQQSQIQEYILFQLS